MTKKTLATYLTPAILLIALAVVGTKSKDATSAAGVTAPATSVHLPADESSLVSTNREQKAPAPEVATSATAADLPAEASSSTDSVGMKNVAGEKSDLGSETKQSHQDGSISLDEIMSRATTSTVQTVFPENDELDFGKTATLNQLLDGLDKEAQGLHVFSAECYQVLKECRVHYLSEHSLTLQLMATMDGMSSIADHVTESGDTILIIRFHPVK
ncbi:hypothetical protein [Rheinheimera sp.]|uniref:hypothetical protein n=1 Tax=Rheinheimera sp. TaxID=1869214 RepID=UPI00307D2B92